MDKNKFKIEFDRDPDADSCIDGCMEGTFRLTYKGRTLATKYGGDTFLENIKKAILTNSIQPLLDNTNRSREIRKGLSHTNRCFNIIQEERNYESSYGYGSLGKRDKRRAETELLNYVNGIKAIDDGKF